MKTQLMKQVQTTKNKGIVIIENPMKAKKSELVASYNSLKFECDRLNKLTATLNAALADMSKACESCKTYEDDIVNLNKKVEFKTEIIRSKEKTISALRKEKSKILDELDSLNSYIATTNVELREVKSKLLNASNENVVLNKVIEEYVTVIKDMKYDLESLQKENQALIDSKFSFTKMWASIKAPFISAFNKIKETWHS